MNFHENVYILASTNRLAKHAVHINSTIYCYQLEMGNGESFNICAEAS